MQFVSVRAGQWSLQDVTARRSAVPVVKTKPLPRAALPSSRQFNDGAARPAVPHTSPQGQFNIPALPALPPPVAAPAPQAALDAAYAKFDQEQAKLKPSAKLVKDINDASEEHDSPWGRRQERANVGYMAIKSSFRR